MVKRVRLGGLVTKRIVGEGRLVAVGIGDGGQLPVAVGVIAVGGLMSQSIRSGQAQTMRIIRIARLMVKGVGDASQVIMGVIAIARLMVSRIGFR